jgi:hypothetical protein
MSGWEDSLVGDERFLTIAPGFATRTVRDGEITSK